MKGGVVGVCSGAYGLGGLLTPPNRRMLTFQGFKTHVFNEKTLSSTIKMQNTLWNLGILMKGGVVGVCSGALSFQDIKGNRGGSTECWKLQSRQFLIIFNEFIKNIFMFIHISSIFHAYFHIIYTYTIHNKWFTDVKINICYTPAYTFS